MPAGPEDRAREEIDKQLTSGYCDRLSLICTGSQAPVERTKRRIGSADGRCRHY